MVEYKIQHNLSSLSLAITQSLSEFFGVASNDSTSPPDSLPMRMKRLEKRVVELDSRLEGLASATGFGRPILVVGVSSLKHGEMAQRLGSPISSLVARKRRDNFPQWSAEHDPEGFAWYWNEEAKAFFRVEIPV